MAEYYMFAAVLIIAAVRYPEACSDDSGMSPGAIICLRGMVCEIPKKKSFGSSLGIVKENVQNMLHFVEIEQISWRVPESHSIIYELFHHLHGTYTGASYA